MTAMVQHGELIVAALSFMGFCGLSSAVWQVILIATRNHSMASKAKLKDTSSLQHLIKDIVGLIACLLSSYLIPAAINESSSVNGIGDVVRWTDNIISDRIPIFNESKPCIGDSLINSGGACAGGRKPLCEAMAVIIGYLVFDLLYTQFKCRPDTLSRVSVGENVVTLGVFLAALSKLDSSYESGDVHRLQFKVWIFYKLVRLSVQLLMTHHSIFGAKAVSEEDASLAARNGVKDSSANGVRYDTYNLWTIHGVSYDLADFVDRHPGGREAILLGRGRDCTALFESYHAFTDMHRKVLKKYKPVPTSAPAEGSLISDKPDDIPLDPFYETLKTRAIAVLKENGVDPITGRGATASRAAYYFATYVCVVFACVAHFKGYIVGSFFLGVFSWFCGALGHDAGHFCASRNPRVNDFLQYIGGSLMANPVMWQIQHTYAHHSHTNEIENDPDLHHFNVLLRIHRGLQNDKKHYKLQGNLAYVLFAFSFVVYGMCLDIPLGVLMKGTMYGVVEWTDRRRLVRAVAAWAHFIFYLSVFIMGPFVFSPDGSRSAGLRVLTHILVNGWCFAFFSQINHLNEGSFISEKHGAKKSAAEKETPVRSPDAPRPPEGSWAVEQILTANNFAPDSTVWHLLSNGLNLQIEHHLFPGLNHCHLHLLSPMVKSTCKEYGVEYKCYDSWSEIFKATLDWLSLLSLEE